MKEITSQSLAEMLEKEFEGEVIFEGEVHARIDDASQDLDADPGYIFYEAQGRFVLAVDRNREKRSGSYTLRQIEEDSEEERSTFNFVKEKGKIHEGLIYKTGRVITMPIKIAPRAFLQIEPRRIVY